MNPFLKVAFASAGLTFLWSAGSQPAGAEPPQPLYTNTVPAVKKDPRDFMPTFNGVAIFPEQDIYLVNVPNARSVNEAIDRFSDRAAAAILYTASTPLPTIGLGHEQPFGLGILAKMAYHDYFLGLDQVPGREIDLRHEVDTALVNRGLNVSSSTCRETAGRVGSSANTDTPISLHVTGEYDQLLTFYIKLYYKYYSALSPAARLCIFRTLLSIRGVYDDSEQFFINEHSGLFLKIPETENHRLMIQAAKYLTNQLYYQESVANGHPDHANFDNNRNGDAGNNPPMVNVILSMLYGYLTHDFIEYNGRPYQDFTVTALMNLADYSYDDRVRLAARMVLDYISAKVAVSTENLRRSTPFRRRNEDQHYGPTSANGFLQSPLVYSDVLVPGSDPRVAYEPDPQGAFYTILAGNIGVLQLDHTSPPNGHAPPNYAFEMVYAGLSDYRVPPSILDLFVGDNPSRRFYQHFSHYSSEAYAGSPSYLISAGGVPTDYAYLINALGITPSKGDSNDLGVALPTTFLPDINSPGPPDPAITLTKVIQFGKKSTGTDQETVHMCVAPDFACGGPIYVPDAIDPLKHCGDRDPTLICDGKWSFIDRGSDATHPGYYLAIYRDRNGLGEDWGFLEALDTWFIGGSGRLPFPDFQSRVKTANPAIQLRFGAGQVNTYVTQSGQHIQFTLTPHSIAFDPAASFPTPFAHGTIVNSDAMGLQAPQGSGLIKISNPALGTLITLDIRDFAAAGDPHFGIHHPSRISESGEVERAGANQEVWVDSMYPGTGPTAGDFGDPFRTLTDARDGVAVGGTINIIHTGAQNSRTVYSKRMTIRAVPGPVILTQ